MSATIDGDPSLCQSQARGVRSCCQVVSACREARAEHRLLRALGCVTETGLPKLNRGYLEGLGQTECAYVHMRCMTTAQLAFVADRHAPQLDLSIRVEQLGQARDINGRIGLAREHERALLVTKKLAQEALLGLVIVSSRRWRWCVRCGRGGTWLWPASRGRRDWPRRSKRLRSSRVFRGWPPKKVPFRQADQGSGCSRCR